MITKDNKLKVMESFFRYPTRTFHIRELARLTHLSSTGIIKIVKKLRKEKLLVSTKGKTTEEIAADFEGRFPLMKRLYNLYSLYESGLVGHIRRHYEYPRAIVLFGSYATGTDTEKSDIDIAILGSSKKAPDFDAYERKLSRTITIHLVDASSSSREFRNSLANGIVLEGFMELVR